MKTSQPTRGLVQAAKQFWPYYAPAWAFPLALYIFGTLGFLNQTTFSLVVLPIFFLTFGSATLPWLRSKVAYWPEVFWAFLVPFMIWGIAVFGVGFTRMLAKS